MAGISHLDEFKRETLRGLVDETQKDRVPTLADRFLPESQIYSRTFAYDVIKNSQHIAAMIGYGAEPPVVDRDAVAKMHGEITKLGLKYVVTEDELLSIFEARNEDERTNTIDRLVLKGVDLVEAIQKRIDIMKMEAITKGKFEYNANGVKAVVDFGIPAEHKIALTDGDDWDETDHDIIGDLLEWVATYEEANGKQPDAILVSREVFNRMAKNQLIITEAGRPAGSLRASLEDVQSVLAANGLPEITIVTDRKVTAKNPYTGENETIEFMPVNRVVFVSEGVGEFLLGVTVENDFRPGIALEAYDKNEPVESVLRAVAAGFPAVQKPELLLHADVFPGA